MGGNLGVLIGVVVVGVDLLHHTPSRELLTYMIAVEGLDPDGSGVSRHHSTALPSPKRYEALRTQALSDIPEMPYG
jgi:hypothetical protein